jgi:hypothetical protein
MPVDIILRIRPEAYGASFDSLAADVTRVLMQLKRWHETNEDMVSKSGTTVHQISDTP